jgi:hypothetical protein
MNKIKLILFAIIILSAAVFTGCDKSEDDNIADSSKLSCSIEIRCDTILDNMDKLVEGKAELIPEDGLIIKIEKAEFTEGESVFDVLQRELQDRKLHFEYTQSKVYESAYIEGIDNLYEFDCGELSGWVYSVNGDFPSYGCALYKLEDGDAVNVLYTCDLGADVGANKIEEESAAK